MIGRGTFALVERSLRVDVRLLRTHLVRLLFAGIILYMLIEVHDNMVYRQTPGRDFFWQICYLNFGLLNLAAMSFFSTVITEEKEEMTLGLLKMAGISPIGILLGKTSPRLIAALMLLSVQLPFTFLAITLGGVLTNQILAAYLSLMSFSVLLAGLGAFFSTVCRRSNVSAALTTGSLVLIYVGPEFVEPMARELLRRGLSSVWLTDSTVWLCDCVRDGTPFRAIDSILSTGYAGGFFTWQVTSNLVAGALLFGVSWLLFDACTRNETPIAPSRGMTALFSRRVAKTHSNPNRNRAWANALAWKDFHFTTGGLTAVIIKFGCYVLLLTGMGMITSRNWGNGQVSDNVGAMCMFAMLMALGVEIPIYASRLFREEIRWQTWSNLYMLPVSVTKIATNKIIGTLPTFLPGVIIFFFGTIIAPRFVDDFFEQALDEVGFWWFISQYILGVHVVVLLSLIVKWGALPLGIAVVVMGNVLFMTCASQSRGGEEILIVPIFFAIVGTCVSIALIGDRLRALASK
jgi:ABC-type transport system involved in multi-copper enzyme maturation permease subunit